MITKLSPVTAFFIRNLHFFIVLFLFLLCVVFWMISIGSYPLNPDAGHYLTAGKYIVNGLEPYRDFNSFYSPGTYYVFGLLEMLGSKYGEYQKSLIYLLHVINGALIGITLRKLKFDRDLATFASALFILASFCLDGQALVLEPFQNFFILLSLFAAVKFSGYKVAVYAGIFMGCALMSKQTSMFSLPIVTLLIAFPLWFSLPMGQNKSNFYGRLMLFGSMIGLPFLLFCILTGQSIIATFINLATFGGSSKSYVEQEYGLYDLIKIFFNADGGERLLIPIAIASMLIVFISKQNLHRLFVLGVALNLITILFVRGYPHYMQLLMPWGVLVFAALLSECNFQNTQHKTILWTLVIVPFITPVFATVQKLRIQYSKTTIEQQIRLTNEVDLSLANSQNTIIIGYPWLYYTSKITPPEYNLGFIMTEQQIRDRIVLADQIIVMPELIDLFKKILDENLTDKQFYEVKKLNYEEKIVTLYASR